MQVPDETERQANAGRRAHKRKIALVHHEMRLKRLQKLERESEAHLLSVQARIAHELSIGKKRKQKKAAPQQKQLPDKNSPLQRAFRGLIAARKAFTSLLPLPQLIGGKPSLENAKKAVKEKREEKCARICAEHIHDQQLYSRFLDANLDEQELILQQRLKRVSQELRIRRLDHFVTKLEAQFDSLMGLIQMLASSLQDRELSGEQIRNSFLHAVPILGPFAGTIAEYVTHRDYRQRREHAQNLQKLLPSQEDSTFFRDTLKRLFIQLFQYDVILLRSSEQDKLIQELIQQCLQFISGVDPSQYTKDEDLFPISSLYEHDGTLDISAYRRDKEHRLHTQQLAYSERVFVSIYKSITSQRKSKTGRYGYGTQSNEFDLSAYGERVIPFVIECPDNYKELTEIERRKAAMAARPSSPNMIKTDSADHQVEEQGLFSSLYSMVAGMFSSSKPKEPEVIYVPADKKKRRETLRV